MISELYTELTPMKNEDCLGVLTHKEYFKVYDKILEEGQKLGTKLDDKDVNLYALIFMSTRLKPNELLLSEKTEKERCKEFKLGEYETSIWTYLSAGECLAGNCIIDIAHPDPMVGIMSPEFCNLHKSMSGFIMYRPYMALSKLREFQSKGAFTDKTVELWAHMLMSHERRHEHQSASMIEKCNRWTHFTMTATEDFSMKRDSDHRFDVAEEDANRARLDAGMQYLKRIQQ